MRPLRAVGTAGPSFAFGLAAAAPAVLLLLIAQAPAAAAAAGGGGGVCGGGGGGVEEEGAALLQVSGAARRSVPCEGERAIECELSSNSPEFDGLVRSCSVLAEKDYSFAHEAPVYVPAKDLVLFASNRRGEGAEQVIELLTVDLKTCKVELLPERIWKEEIVMANGGTLDFRPGSSKRCADKADSVLLTSQGNMNRSAGIYRLNLDTLAVEQVVSTSSWEAQNFNSPNDVALDPVSGAILFTDPVYGYFQDFRPQPKLGNWLWSFSPGSAAPARRPGGGSRVLADGFSRPNGLAFASERGDTLLVTDTGLFPGAESASETSIFRFLRHHNLTKLRTSMKSGGPRTAYAFDVQRDGDGRIVRLSNRRVLFQSASGVPDGIKVDCAGRIYAGVGDGVDVFDRDGFLLGSLAADPEYGCANLVLVPRGATSDLIAMCETRILKFTLDTRTCSLGASKRRPGWPWTGAAEE